MSKTSLTKVQEYAIRYLHDVMKMTPKTIAKELRISLPKIDKLLGSNSKKSKSIKNQQTNTDQPQPTHTRRGVSVMTEQVSIQGDQLYKKLMNVVSRTARNAIFRPRGN